MLRISKNAIRQIEERTGIKTVYRKDKVNDYLVRRYSDRLDRFVKFFNGFTEERKKFEIFECKFSKDELKKEAFLPCKTLHGTQKTTAAKAQWNILCEYIEKNLCNCGYVFSYEDITYTVTIKKYTLDRYAVKNHSSGIVE